MLNPQTASLTDDSPQVRYFQGDLTADNFDFGDNLASFANQIIVISGNGNLKFGEEIYDSLDFSAFSVDSVTEFNLAEIDAGGVVYDLGDGDRVFDSLTLNNGSQILFEGIDRLVFGDRTIDLTITPEDPNYAQQWNLHMVGVQNAWRFTTGTEDVLLGIQDSGLGVRQNSIHSDLRLNHYNPDNIADDFFNNNQGAEDGARETSHGTSVQGIIAAESDNGEGIAGINWNSEVYQIDVIHNNTGDLGFIEATQAMIDVAKEEERNLVVNLSLGEDTFDTVGQSAVDLEQIIVTNPNVLFVIAAGNQGHLGQLGLDSPAILAKYYDNVVAVGAVWGSQDVNGNETIPGTRIEYPQGWGSQYGEGLTVVAPSEVLTTSALSNGDFDYTSDFNGTSAAAPHVSGVASLIWSANPDLSAIEIKDIISETAYDLGEEGYDLEYGYGFINADGAVRRAIALGRESNNPAEIGDSIRERVREMLDSFQARFPDVDLSRFYDLYYGSDSDFFAGFDFFNYGTDPLTGAGSGLLTTSDFNNLAGDDLLATDSNSADFPSLEESANYNLGVDPLDTFDNNAVESVGLVNNDLFGGIRDDNFDNLSLEDF